MAPILSANKAAELARATLACAAGCLLTAGCATFSPSAHKDQKPEPGTVSQVMVMWQPQVQMSLDPVHGGTSVPCLAGRLYLFGPDDKVHTAEGTVRVNLYSDDVHGPDGQPFLASYWQLDSAKLKSALRKDTVGWGYTLILPLAKVEPGPSHVHLTVQYQPPKGMPAFTSSGPMVLQPPDAPQPVYHQETFTPGVPQPASAAPQQQQGPPVPPVVPSQGQVPAAPQQAVQQVGYRPGPAGQPASQVIWPWASPPPPGALPGLTSPALVQPALAAPPPVQATPPASGNPWQYRPAGASPGPGTL
jgi:hypothetical protein